MKRFCVFTTIIFWLGCILPIQSQVSRLTDIKDEAYRYFSEKNFEKAMPLYKELLKTFPKEPEYQYRLAICLVDLNKETEQAIQLLQSVTVSNTDPLSWYYLGSALHSYFLFEDAIKAYSKFIVSGKKSDIRLYNPERLIEMCRNGIEFTRKGHSIVVQSTQAMPVKELDKASVNRSGKIMKKPLEFCSKADTRYGYKPLMFFPTYTEINEYIYITGYEQGKRNKQQIFRVKNVNHETWALPEALDPVINSPYDEEFPYFDRKTSTLYFCSKGHSSMGGYDIFKSVYDWNTKSWSKPENMGFPINSPKDDYFYMTDESGRFASFVSTRNTSSDSITYYQIKLQQDTSGIKFQTIEDIRKAALLNAEPWVPEPVIEVSENDIVTENSDDNEEILPKYSRNAYERVLAEALTLQVKADSTARLSRDARIRLKESPDDSLKQQIVIQLRKTDKDSKEYQSRADRKFSEARELKKASVTSPGSTASVNLKKEVNGIKVYQYSDSMSVSDDRTLSTSETLSISSTENNSKDLFNVFDKSPYNEGNPIPDHFSIPSGLVYRIQMGAFSKIKANDAFGGIHPISFERQTGGSVYKYFAGLFYTHSGASKALETVRKNGYPDAFVVAYYNGAPITTEKAREIEFASYKL